MNRPHVLIVGAGGTFGSRLARLLARRALFRISLGGRNAATVMALAEELRAIDPQGEFGFAQIDRQAISGDRLREIGCWIVVDCAGPFEPQHTQLIEAAIAARCNYLDLADNRAFVAAIRRFDQAARAAGIAVVSGASTTPALTHAVLNSVAAGWRQADSIDIAIVPGNRAPKGRSVVEAILGWVGRPVKVFEETGWVLQPGWSGTRWVRIDGLKPRRAGLAEVPDLDLLASRYRPRIRARLDAGMELGLLHGLIGLAGRCVQLKLVRSAALFTEPGLFVARLLDRFGTDSGGMVIEIAGLDQRMEAKQVRWSLVAQHGDGPYVPAIPAAAAVIALAKGQAMTGARAAAGLVTLDMVRPWFEGLAIETKTAVFKKEIPLYARVIGEEFATLPEVTRRLHRGRPAILADGEAAVIGGRNPLARFVARLLGMPKEASNVPVRVLIEARDGREYWTRWFDGEPMRSVMSRAGEGLIEERFGAVRIRMALVARPEGLDMLPIGGHVGVVPLPRFLLPRIKAEERAEAGLHRFDVDVALPLIGRLVAYRGWLAISS